MGCAIRILPGFVGVVLSAFGPMAPPAIAADAISLRFEGFGLLGVPVLTLRHYLDESEDRYAITVDYTTSGIAGVVIDLTSHAEVTGRFSADSAQPERYRKETRRNGVDRRNRVDYLADGTVVGSSAPPEPERGPPVAASGTVDNLTAYFLLERQLARTGSCALTVPVFDGQHRYDLYFSDAGQQLLSPAGGQRFEGSTIACRMERRHLVGNPDPEQREGARRGTIWYARLVPGDVLTPVRMQLETQIGTIDGYLAALSGRGVELRLME